MGITFVDVATANATATTTITTTTTSSTATTKNPFIPNTTAGRTPMSAAERLAALKQGSFRNVAAESAGSPAVAIACTAIPTAADTSTAVSATSARLAALKAKATGRGMMEQEPPFTVPVDHIATHSTPPTPARSPEEPTNGAADAESFQVNFQIVHLLCLVSNTSPTPRSTLNQKSFFHGLLSTPDP